MKLLIFVFALTVSSSASPFSYSSFNNLLQSALGWTKTSSEGMDDTTVNPAKQPLEQILPNAASALNVNNKLQDALRVAAGAIDDTFQYAVDETKTSSAQMNMQMIVNQADSAFVRLFANASSALNSSKFDLPTGQEYINSMLDISILSFNQIVVKIQDEGVVNEFRQKTVTTYDKICDILLPLLHHTKGLVKTWDDINRLRITTIDELEYLKEQTKPWPNSINFIKEADRFKPKFIMFFNQVYTELFRNTLKPENRQIYIDYYLKLDSEVRRIFDKEISDAETVVISHLGDNQYWSNLWKQIPIVRKVFLNAKGNTFRFVNRFYYSQ